MLELLILALFPIQVSCRNNSAAPPIGVIVGIVVFVLAFLLLILILCCYGSYKQKKQQKKAIENNSRKPLEDVQSAYPRNPNAHYVPLVEQLEAKAAQCRPPLIQQQAMYAAPQPVPGMTPSDGQMAMSYQNTYAMAYMQQQQVSQPVGCIPQQQFQQAPYQPYQAAPLVPPAAEPPEVVPKPVKQDSSSYESTSSV